MKRQGKKGLRRWFLWVLATMGVLLAAFIVFRAWMPTVCWPPPRSDRSDAAALRSAAFLYLADEAWGSCPTVEALTGGRYLDATRSTTDAWGTAFRIECSEDDVVIISAGPDLAFDTEDDIDNR